MRLLISCCVLSLYQFSASWTRLLYHSSEPLTRPLIPQFHPHHSPNLFSHLNNKAISQACLTVPKLDIDNIKTSLIVTEFGTCRASIQERPDDFETRRDKISACTPTTDHHQRSKGSLTPLEPSFAIVLRLSPISFFRRRRGSFGTTAAVGALLSLSLS
ncbi:hypothetical protein BJ878DRAFT_307419 [Calycina marina]|uniref:Uncharacterized protein n=1 Tax=Calycina marina TaxID=1763456 RepID=A0A9P7Z723_9HELO|nr:hypothetical protein BJ878DRAFT_307419 [Calycina marina]